MVNRISVSNFEWFVNPIILSNRYFCPFRLVIYKKQGLSPISLVRATRLFSKAKTMKIKMICHWTFEKKEKKVFFRLTTFFFRNKKILSKEQLLFSFLCIVKQKKISEQSEKKIFENFF